VSAVATPVTAVALTPAVIVRSEQADNAVLVATVVATATAVVVAAAAAVAVAVTAMVVHTS
jgi:hypothetical protein